MRVLTVDPLNSPSSPTTAESRRETTSREQTRPDCLLDWVLSTGEGTRSVHTKWNTLTLSSWDSVKQWQRTSPSVQPSSIFPIYSISVLVFTNWGWNPVLIIPAVPHLWGLSDERRCVTCLACCGFLCWHWNLTFQSAACMVWTETAPGNCTLRQSYDCT